MALPGIGSLIGGRVRLAAVAALPFALLAGGVALAAVGAPTATGVDNRFGGARPIGGINPA